MSFLNLAMCLFGVLMLGLFVDFVRRRRQLSQKIVASQQATTRLALWMANFYGTHRDEDYDPPYPRQECQDMIDFLRDVNHYSSSELLLIAEDQLDSGSVPCIVHGDEQRYRAHLIGEVCRALQKKQLA